MELQIDGDKNTRGQSRICAMIQDAAAGAFFIAVVGRASCSYSGKDSGWKSFVQNEVK